MKNTHTHTQAALLIVLTTQTEHIVRQMQYSKKTKKQNKMSYCSQFAICEPGGYSDPQSFVEQKMSH